MLKLEVGKTYITVGGNECDIVYKNENVTDGYSFIGLVKEHHLCEERGTTGWNDFLAAFKEDGTAKISASLVKKKSEKKIFEQYTNIWLLNGNIVPNTWKNKKEAEFQIKDVTKKYPEYRFIKTIHIKEEIEIDV